MRYSFTHFAQAFLLAFALATLHAADKVKASPIDLKSLPRTDTLEIQYFINGCFQFERYSVRLAGDRIEISELHLPAVLRAPIVFDRRPLGSLQLTKTEIEGLDLMLRHFRIPNRVISTSSVRVELKQMREGQLVREENIIYFEDDKPAPNGLLTISTLIERLKALKDVPAS